MIDLTEKYVGDEWRNSSGVLLNPNYAFLIGEHLGYAILCMQGGTRSGKTFACFMWLIDVAKKHNGIKIVIVRESRNSVERSSFHTFRDVMMMLGIYDEVNLNKTKLIYTLGKSEFHFIGAEDENKAKGVECNILYLNEAGNISWSVAQQYIVRANMRCLIDYNPSYPQSWIYDNILPRDNVAFLRTNYTHNPYITEMQLAEILWAKDNNPEWYKIYGEGERGVLKGQIYSGWQSISDDAFPTYWDNSSRCYVIDFGSEDPSCITEAVVDDEGRELFLRECFYKPVYDPVDLAIQLWFMGHRHYMSTPIICDSADPASIKSLRFGFNVTEEYVILRCMAIGQDIDDNDLGDLMAYLKEGYGYIYPVNKNYGKGGKINAVKRVKQYKVYMTEGSVNGWKEYQLYRFPEDKQTGEAIYKLPEKNDHFLDTVLYAVVSKANNYF